MARKGQFKQTGGKEPEKTGELSILDSNTEVLPNSNTVENAEGVNNPRRLTSVQRRANYAAEDNAVARKAATPDKPAVGNSAAAPIPLHTNEQTAVYRNNIAGGGNSSGKNIFAVAAISFSCFLAIFVLIFCIIPLKQISYEVPIAYQDIETYTEMEPYLDTVYYTEREPYTVTEAYTVSQPYTTTEPYIIYNPRPMPPWPPPHSGNWTHPRPPLPPPQPVISYREVTRYADVTKYRDVIQYKDVQKTKNEIKFRPVQKQRTVAKVRMETRYRTVPLLYYLML